MPPTGNANTEWTYEMLDTSEDKRTSRVGVRAPKSHELIGVDGSLGGGIRVFPGFTKVHEFDMAGWETATGYHDETSTIIDGFPTDFIIGDDGYGFGIVYRVRRSHVKTLDGDPSSDDADIFIDYYNSKLGEWTRGYLLMSRVALSPTEDPINGKQMSVSVFGRFVYVFLEQASPVVFYTDRTAWTPVLLTNPGPGLQPTLISPENSLALGSMTSTGGKSGAGQIRLLDYAPSETGLFDVAGSGSGSGSGSGTVLTYPDGEEDIRRLPSGDYAFAYVLFSSDTGRRSALSEIAQARTEDWTDADLGLTGTPLYAAFEVCYDSAKFDQAYVYRSVRVQSAGGTYVASILHLEKIITLEDYNTVNVLFIGSYAQSIYWYYLEDKQLVFQDVFTDRATFDQYMPEGGASCIYEGTLLVSNIKASATSSSEESRPGDALTGLGELRYSSLSDPSPELFPPNNRYVPNVPSNEIVAMRAVGPNAIGFSRDRQYHVRKEGTYIKVQEMHEGFGVLNYRCVDTVGSLIYFVTSKGIKAVDTQGSLDDVRSLNELIINTWKDDWNHLSVAFDAGLSAFFVMNAATGEAAVFWFTTAMVTELRDLPFQLCCRGPWPSDFEWDQEELETNDGAGNDTYRNPLVERAFFIKNPTADSVADTNVEAIWSLYQVDQKKENLQATGSHGSSARRTLLPFEGNSVFTVTSDFTTGNTLTLSLAGGKDGPSFAGGCRIYVLQAADTSLVGQQATIKMSTIGPVALVDLTLATAGNLYGLAAGDIVGVSPVYFRWVGSPLGSQDTEDMQKGKTDQGIDFFRIKHVNSIGAAFTGVSGTATTDTPSSCRFRAMVFKGNETTASYGADTVDLNGASVQSVQEGDSLYFASFGGEADLMGKYGVEGPILTPGVEVFVPDLDFELVQVMVTGGMRATYRRGRAS